MEEEYILFIPEDIKPQKEYGYGLGEKEIKKAIKLSVLGGVPIGFSYLITHLDVVTILAVLTWIFISFNGYAKTWYNGRRSTFEQVQIISKFKRSQKYFPYQYKGEWR